MNDLWLAVAWAAWAAAMTPLGFMLGGSCSPCCGNACGDNLPVEDPEINGNYVISRPARFPIVSFTPNPGDTSGETWIFYGSASSSRPGGGASVAEQEDWGNLCNWYTGDRSLGLPPGAGGVRASRLPNEDSVVHIQTPVSTNGERVVRVAYIWGTQLKEGSILTATGTAPETTRGVVFILVSLVQDRRAVNRGTVNGGALIGYFCDNYGTINGGADFLNQSSRNYGTVNGGAVFKGESAVDGLALNFSIVNGGAVFDIFTRNDGTVNDGATFRKPLGSPSSSEAATVNRGVVNGGAVFENLATNTPDAVNAGIVNGGATFNGKSWNGFFSFASGVSGLVNDGATFNDESATISEVNGGAIFNDDSFMDRFATVNNGAVFNGNSSADGVVNGGAIFNDNSFLDGEPFVFGVNLGGVVNGGATFNDAACSKRPVGAFNASPCTRKFVAHPTDLPTCNGTAPDGCASAAVTCGCG